jgi:hypothetical protein
MDFYDLIGSLVRDIQHLESKVVFLRFSLSRFLSEHDGEMLRCDIFSDLRDSYFDQLAFNKYVSKYCNGIDPLDNTERCEFLMRVSRGEEAVNL